MHSDSAQELGIGGESHTVRAGAITSPMNTAAVPEEELARAGLYRLLAKLLAAPPDATILAEAAAIEGGPSEIGAALSALGEAAARAEPKALQREYHDLFIGLGEGELVPYGSYYLSGFLHEKPLARLRRDLAALAIARAEDISEPEDGIASLCEIMAGLITGAFGEPAALDVQREFFERHVNSWAANFFADLSVAETAALYRPVGALGRRFMELESEAFRIAD